MQVPSQPSIVMVAKERKVVLTNEEMYVCYMGSLSLLKTVAGRVQSISEFILNRRNSGWKYARKSL